MDDGKITFILIINIIIHLNNYAAKSQVPKLMIVSPFDAGVTRRVKHAYSTLDAISIRTGVFLKRYPLIRICVFCYVVCIIICFVCNRYANKFSVFYLVLITFIHRKGKSIIYQSLSVSRFFLSTFIYFQPQLRDFEVEI